MTHEELREIDKRVAVEMGLDVSTKDKHDWEMQESEDGGSPKIDEMAYSSGYHNGPRCRRCGYCYCVHCGEGDPGPCEVSIPHYSSDPTAADQLLRHIATQSGEAGIAFDAFGAHASVNLGNEGEPDYGFGFSHTERWELALCLAFLEARRKQGEPS